MTVVVHPQLSGLAKKPAAEKPPAPELSPEVRALLSTAGCAATWQGFTWNVWRAGKGFMVGAKPKSFEDWRATIKAVVDATSHAPTLGSKSP